MTPLEWSGLVLGATILLIAAAGSVALPATLVSGMERLRWVVISISALGALGAVWAPDLAKPISGSVFAGTASFLACFIGRQRRLPNRVVLHYASPSPGTRGRREIVDGMWCETLEPLVLYITPQDWSAITAATPEATAWLERHQAAPNLYRMPATQEAMQVVDSLRLYPFLVNSRHTAAIDAFAAALRRPATVPSPTAEAPSATGVSAAIPAPKRAAAAAQPDLVLELEDRSETPT